MAILDIEYNSTVLGMARPLKVIYPEASHVEAYVGRDIPVLTLLHGMSGNENSWLIRTAIDRLVRHTEIAVVMPATDLAWYTNTTYGMRYFDALADELPQVLGNFFPNLSAKREKNFVAGLSMGGYGAFKLALATERFSYGASLSGALALRGAAMETQVAAQKDYFQGIFGDIEKFESSENNLVQLARKKTENRPKLYAWCGQEDILYETNNYATSELKKLGYDLIYETAHGTHDWYYWARQIERVLEWMPIDWVKEERLS